MASPTTATTDVMMANNALSLLGSEPIEGFDEESELAGAVNSVYVDVVETCLGAHKWTFGLTMRQLQLEAATPQGYRYSFALPADRLSLPVALFDNIRTRNPVRDFAVVDQSILADCQTLWARFRYRPGVDLWPGAFRLFVARALAANLAVPVTQDANLAATFDQAAWGGPSEGRRGGLFMEAMKQDLSHPGPEAIFATDPLTDAWHGGV